MAIGTPYSVNVRANSNGKEWTQRFVLLPQAGLYARKMSSGAGMSVNTYSVLEHNFVMPPDAELDAFARLEKSVVENARRLEKQAKLRTLLSFENPELYPCEVCGSKEHATYICCESCNIDRHTCHFCGDSLGHDTSFSVCYIMDQWEENYALLR